MVSVGRSFRRPVKEHNIIIQRIPSNIYSHREIGFNGLERKKKKWPTVEPLVRRWIRCSRMHAFLG